MSATLKEVGRVVALAVHPVKSMGGHALDELRLGWQGFDGDRRYAFTRTGSLNGLPWLSARTVPGLVGYQAMLEDAEDARGSSIVVRTPAGERLAVRDPRLAEAVATLAGGAVHLMRLHRGTFDSAPVSIITTNSIATIAQAVGVPLDPRRFRSNIVVEATGTRAYPEEKWIGSALVFGEGRDPARVRANRRPVRCSIVNLDPDSGEADQPVHRAIVEQRRNELGAWGVPERTGVVRVGDVVYVRQ